MNPEFEQTLLAMRDRRSLGTTINYQLHCLKTLLSMNEIIFLIEEDPEGGYVARAIGKSIFTQADTIAALREFIRDAVKCHFEDRDRPKLIRLHFVRDEVIAS